MSKKKDRVIDYRTRDGTRHEMVINTMSLTCVRRGRWEALRTANDEVITVQRVKESH